MRLSTLLILAPLLTAALAVPLDKRNGGQCNLGMPNACPAGQMCTRSNGGIGDPICIAWPPTGGTSLQNTSPAAQDTLQKGAKISWFGQLKNGVGKFKNGMMVAHDAVAQKCAGKNGWGCAKAPPGECKKGVKGYQGANGTPRGAPAEKKKKSALGTGVSIAKKFGPWMIL